MSKRLILGGLAAFSVLGASSLARAQVNEINLGSRLSADLTGADAVSPDGKYRYDDYRVSLTAGQRVEALLRSTVFDAYLAVYSADNLNTPVFSDDDGGGGTDARVRFSPPTTGNYVVRARTLNGLDGGAYTLAVSERPVAGPPPRPRLLTLGTSVDGVLGGTDPELSEDGGRYDGYRFVGRAGQRVSIEMRSGVFDTYLELGRQSAAGFEALHEDDDGLRDGQDSRIVFTVPAAGEYVVRARSYAPDESGEYTVIARELPLDPAPQVLALDTSVDGIIAAGDPVSLENVNFDAYRVQGTDGRGLLVTVQSATFDPVVLVGKAGGEFEALASGEGEARYVFPDSEAYVLRVMPGEMGQLGNYTLTVTDLAPVACDDSAATTADRIVACTRAIERGVTTAERAQAFVARAQVYQALEDYQSAIRDYREAVTLDDATAAAAAAQFALALNRRGSQSYATRDYQSAWNDYNEAISLDPTEAVYFYNRGLAYGSMTPAAQWDRWRSYADYSEATRLNPNYGPAWVERGFIQNQAGNHSQAVAEMTRAITLLPNSAPAYLWRARSKHALGDDWGAITDFSMSLALSPNDAGALNDRGNSYFALSQWDRAIGDFEAALRLNPGFTIASQNRQIAYEARNNAIRASNAEELRRQQETEAAVRGLLNAVASALN